MKLIITILSVLFSLNSYGINTNYYVSNAGNDGNNGTSTGTPWRTITKVNSIVFGSGDRIYFNRGDTWIGVMLDPNGNGIGTGVSKIIIDAYGTGAMPAISGFTVITSWTNVGTNLWESVQTINSGSRLSMVIKDGIPKHMGRFPNLEPEGVNSLPLSWRATNGRNAGRGYLDYETNGSVANDFLIDNELDSASPTTNWATGEIVIRSESWVMNKTTITSRSGNRLNWNTSQAGNLGATKGYFIQNHTLALDVQDEWYYNPSTFKLRVYSVGSPSGVWKAASLPDVINMSALQSWTIQNIRVEGGDLRGIKIDGSVNLSILNSEIYYTGTESGQMGGSIAATWNGATSTNLLIEGNTINYAHDFGISMRTESSNGVTIRLNTIKNIGLFPGTGDWVDTGYSATMVYATNTLFEYNRFDSIGYSAISTNGANMTIRFNEVSNHCLTKSDGAGIYSSNTLGAGTRFIYKNLVHDGGDPLSGQHLYFDIAPHSEVRGIYLDEVSDNYTIYGNSLWNLPGEAIYLHLLKNVNLRENTIFNAKEYAFVNDNNISKAGATSAITWKSNITVSTSSLAKAWFHKDDADNMGTVYTMDSNYYIYPFSSPAGIFERTVDAWPGGAYLESWKGLPSLKAHYPAFEVHSWLTPVNYKQYTTSTNVGANLAASTTASGSGSFSVTIPATNSNVDIPGTPQMDISASNQLTTSKWYRLKFVAQKASAGQHTYDGVVALTSTNRAQNELVDRIYSGNNQGFNISLTPDTIDWIFEVHRNSGGYDITPVRNAQGVIQYYPAAVSRIQFTQQSGTAVNITGIDLHEVTVTFPTISDSVRIVYNRNFTTDSTISIPGTWVNHKGVSFTNSIVLQPFTSAVLLKVANIGGNNPPTAVAGTDIEITLPIDTAALNGSSSFDSDGTITTYLWTRISGPNTPTFSPSANVASPVIDGLIEGTYLYKLTVTDNGALTDVDTVSVLVNAEPFNPPPTVDVGPDRAVESSALYASLSADASDDGSIATYLWTKESGGAGTFSSASTAATLFEGFAVGVYVIRCTVTDNLGETAFDELTITVTTNQFPEVSAGVDKNIQLPTTSTSSTATASDPDGTISSTVWQQFSGPNTAGISAPSSLTTNFTGLIEGIYFFKFTATDNQSAENEDNYVEGSQTDNYVKVTVLHANIPPIAAAGSNQTIQLPTDQVSLSAGSSTDPDGTITTYAWSKIVGTGGSFTAAGSVNTDFTGLTAGTYAVKLTVTDNQSATGLDTMTITVLPANVAPSVDAGPNDTIQLPVSTYTPPVIASDPDGFIDSVSWVETAGPNTPTFTPNAGTLGVTLGNLIVGQYTFRVYVFDEDGLSDFDDIIITVLAANVLPTASAGTDKAIRLPISTTTLNGTSGDADGTITVLWTKTSGPATFAITSPLNDTTGLTNLVAGVYIFRLTVTDNNGAETIDEVMVTVTAANVLPVVSAGVDKTITLLVDSVLVTGSVSDADGTIDDTTWTQTSGPNTAVISKPDSTVTWLRGLIAGTYVFRLTATDNEDSIRYDEMTIVVLPEPPNQPPVANAGAAVTLQTPATSVMLNGSASTDPDGTITGYSWAKISGTGGTIVTPTLVNTNVTGLSLGSYLFRLTVTDNDGATDTHDVIVVVAEASSTIRVRGRYKIVLVDE